MAASCSHTHYTDKTKDATHLHRFVSSEFFYTQERFLYQKKAYFLNFLFMYSKGP